MYPRLCKLSKSRSFFLFGPRGTGKSTLLDQWKKGKKTQIYDLLDPIVESEISLRPQRVLENWQARPTEWVIIDEIQKVPQLLDVVHKGIQAHKIKFALTGSSARKLRRGASNLLGGRASEFHLHPLMHIELGNDFQLHDVLQWGSLPEIFQLDPQEKVRALSSYVSTYLKEEILVEQIIRKIEPFRKFLEVAAQMNGKIINYAKIGRDAGVEEKSVARYYQILEDTLLGFYLEPFHFSIRKRQASKSKFYFFDCGVTRALQNQLTLRLVPQSIPYGDLFEQFIFLELVRLNDALEKKFRFSYFRTKDDVEIDLIIERPGMPLALVEIKSKKKNDPEDAKALENIGLEIGQCECFVLNDSAQATNINKVKFRPWREGIEEIFG